MSLPGLTVVPDTFQNTGTTRTMNVYFLQGVFGELPNCNGIMEELILPPEGGTFMKIVGCPFLYKGNPENRKVYGMEQGKSNISTLPREIIGKSVIYVAAVALRFLFQKKKFIHDLHIFANELINKTIKHVGQPEIRYNQFVKEVRRAMDAALKKEFKIPADAHLIGYGVDEVKWKPVEIAVVITKLVAFLCVMMEYDAAYRFPTQDVFGELKKENVKKNARKEAVRLLGVYVERGIKLDKRIVFIKKVFSALFWFSPRARRITQYFLEEVDVEKVKLDEADWYFTLRRNTYNFGGKTLDERLIELDRIDREKGTQYVKIEFSPELVNPPPNV